MMNQLKTSLFSLVPALTAIVLGLLVGAVVILATGASVSEAYAAMWEGAFGSLYAFATTLGRATPIILIALAVAVGFRAGFFNLGGEGQMLLGALAGALTAIYLPGPGLLKLTAALLAGFLVGGLYALLAAWLEIRFRMNLLITTLLLNYIAIYFTGYLVREPFYDDTATGGLSQTVMIDKSAWLPKLFAGMSVHAGLLIAVLATLMLAFVFRKTVIGYELNMLGKNASFAAYGGIDRIRVMMYAMLLSGGLAGLAGTGEVLGSQYRFIEGGLTEPNYAWTGLMATLLGNSHPLGSAVAAIFLAALQTGARGMERNTDIPLEISGIIQASLILFVSVKITYSFVKRRKGKQADGSVV